MLIMPDQRLPLEGGNMRAPGKQKSSNLEVKGYFFGREPYVSTMQCSPDSTFNLLVWRRVLDKMESCFAKDKVNNLQSGPRGKSLLL